MYNNSGTKIKNLADFLAVTQIIIAFVEAIAVFGWLHEESPGLAFFIALIVFAVGAVLAWLANLLLGGFGDLIQETSRIRVVAEAWAKENKVKLPEEEEAEDKEKEAPAVHYGPEPVTNSGVVAGVKIEPVVPRPDTRLRPTPEKVPDDVKNFCPFCGSALRNNHCANCDADF